LKTLVIIFVDKELYQIDDSLSDAYVYREGRESMTTTKLFKRLGQGFFSLFSIEDLPLNEKYKKVNSDTFDRMVSLLREVNMGRSK
jgi:hypothetical protein